VILYAQKDGIAIADRLVDHGVACIVILPEKLDQLYHCLRLIANAAGQPERADRAVAACEGMIRKVQNKVKDIADDQRLRVYFASAMGPFFTTSGDLLQDEIITKAGGVNVSHDLKGYFREISPERFIDWNPDLVIGSAPVMDRLRQTLRQPQYGMVKAVVDQRIRRFPSNLAPWDFPSPLSAVGIMWLAVQCYPDRFADIDIMNEIDHFHIALFGKSFQALGGKLGN
jgi:iron complex transport system substrate-binding protein